MSVKIVTFSVVLVQNIPSRKVITMGGKTKDPMD